MKKKAYVGVNGESKQIKKMYVGVNNEAREIVAAYVGESNTYTPIEYIQSTGTQFIDTGLKALSLIQTGRIEEKTQYSNSTTRQQYGYTFYNSIEQDNNVFFVPIGILNGNWHTQFDRANSFELATANTNVNTFITDMLNKKAYINGTSYNITTNNTGTQDGNIFLFCRNANGAQFCSKKVYYTKIYNNNVLVRDFIPVKDSNNVACLYDKVENKAYYNLGTGTFTAGSATGEPAITGSYARKIADKGTTSYFYSAVIPTSWSGTSTAAGAVFSSSNTYGTWKVSGNLAANNSTYVSWKAIDGDQNTYYSTNGLKTLTITCPDGISINPHYVQTKTQYVTSMQVKGVSAKNGEEKLLFEYTQPSGTTSTLPISCGIETDEFFTALKFYEVSRYNSYPTFLYNFVFPSGQIRDER